MIKLCVFDLDGTLLNTLPALTKVINTTLKELSLEGISGNEVKKFVGSGYKNFVDNSIDFLSAKAKIDINKAYETYEKNFNLYNTHEVKAYDGIYELLDELKNRNIKIVILSNKAQNGVETNVKKYFKEGIFSAFYGERPNVKIKPDKEGLELIIKEFGVKKEELLYIGDSDVDMQTSVNANVCGVGVLWGFRDEKELMESGAKYIVKSPKEILDLI